MTKERQQQFLDEVCAEIKAKKTHLEIRQELASHLEDLICEKEATGVPRDEAIAWAIVQMGNPQSLGKELHQIHKPNIPWGLFGVVALLSAISLIGMGSVDVGYADINKGPFLDNALGRQSINILIGIVLMFGMYFIDFRKLKGLAWVLYGLSLTGILTSMLWGITVNGVNYGPQIFTILPGMTSYRPYVLMVALAGILVKRNETLKKKTWRSGLFDISILLAPALLLISLKSLPELVVYLISALVLYVWVTRDWKMSAMLFGFFVTVGLISILTNDYLMARIISTINPSLDPHRYGYIYQVMREVISSAGWWGHGFGSVEQKLSYVYSDMLPIYLIHCFGWAGALLLLAVITWFFIKLLSTIRAIREPYGQALVLGLAFLLAIRLTCGFAVMSGGMVPTSIPFPFLSYGSHVWFEYAAIGLLMGIYRRKDIGGVQERSVSS
jgi:cell division protein FtsW (lipid II flippase)